MTQSQLSQSWYLQTQLAQPVLKLDKATTAEVVATLGSPTLAERYRARIELTSRNPNEVVAAVNDWVKQFDANNPEHARHFVEALWTGVRNQSTDINASVREAVLRSPVPDARAAGVRALRESIRSTTLRSVRGDEAFTKNAIQLIFVLADKWLLQFASDPSPQVRAEAVVAATSAPGAGNIELRIDTTTTSVTDAGSTRALKKGEVITLLRTLEQAVIKSTSLPQ